MIKILFIIAAALLHFPHSYYAETINRFNKMEIYNPFNAFIYEKDNGNLEGSSWIFVNAFLAYICALIPLSYITNIHWVLLIIFNWAWGSFIIPGFTFALYPSGIIYSKR